jgi:hypothetical protein
LPIWQKDEIMSSFTVKSYQLQDVHYDSQWKVSVEDRWNYRDFITHPQWKEGWISFDCLYYDPDDGYLYSGITSFASDIFKRFDTGRKTFEDTGYGHIADPYDAKFHRSLEKYQGDGCIYAAVALLHDVDHFFDAPGGAIVKYNPKTGTCSKEVIPFPHIYIQSIVIDQQRGILYGQTFTPEKFFSYNLETKKIRDLGPIGSGMGMAQGENIILDDDGCVWGNWGVTRAWQSFYGVDGIRLLRYSPDSGKVDYLTAGLPKKDGKYGFEKAEAFFNFGTGCLYASGANGALYRIETDGPEISYIGEPIVDRRSRLASMVLMGNGKAYGVTGRDGSTELLMFDPRNDTYKLLGAIVDENNNTPYQVHHVTAGPEGVLYAGENDNPYRSSYLWELSDFI